MRGFHLLLALLLGSALTAELKAWEEGVRSNILSQIPPA